MKESVVEAYLRTQFLKLYPEGQIHKYTPRKSEPDRIMLLPGGFAVFVEVKRPKEVPRPDQIRALDRLRNLGFRAEWVDSKTQIDILLNVLKEYHP